MSRGLNFEVDSQYFNRLQTTNFVFEWDHYYSLQKAKYNAWLRRGIDHSDHSKTILTIFYNLEFIFLAFSEEGGDFQINKAIQSH